MVRRFWFSFLMVVAFFAGLDFQMAVAFFADGGLFCWIRLPDDRAFLMVQPLFAGGPFFVGRGFLLTRAFFDGQALICGGALLVGRTLS
jgi:hypothetical protein